MMQNMHQADTRQTTLSNYIMSGRLLDFYKWVLPWHLKPATAWPGMEVMLYLLAYCCPRDCLRRSD